MADASFVQTSFAGGEWSHFIQGRFDRPDYRIALNVCLNSLPIDTGAWVRRPGFQFAQPTRNSNQARVIKFDFTQSSPYVMEFTDGFLRFFNGATLVKTNDTQTVLSISTANPAKVATATAHGWSTGNQIMFDALGATCPTLQNRSLLITVTSSTEFTLSDPSTGATIDGSLLTPAFTSGTVSRVLEIATSFAAQSWQNLRSVQAEEQAVLLTGTVKPQVLTVSTDPTPTSFAEFSLTAANFLDGPYLDPVPGGTLVTPNDVTGIVSLTLSFNAYAASKAYSLGDFVTYSNINYKSIIDANLNHQPDISPSQWQVCSAAAAISPNGFVATDVGRSVRLFSEPALWDSTVSYAGGTSVTYAGTYWKSLASSNLNNQPGIDATKWALNSTAAIWVWGRITSLLTLIDRALAGSVVFGDMTSPADAFDGITNKSGGASKHVASTVVLTYSAYVGKNYSGASAQKIASATVYPSAPNGIAIGFLLDNQTPQHTFEYGPLAVQLFLRGKMTAPANAADGTTLAFTQPFSNTNAPITMISGDQTTAWNYVWVECRQLTVNPDPTRYSISSDMVLAQVQFFNPPSPTGNGINVQLVNGPLLYTTPIRTWRLGAYSDTTGWPKNGTYHEGRLWLSGAIDNRIDGSKSNDIFNFAPTNQDGSVSANNAINYTFDAPDVNPIFWMEPDLQGIICGTQAGEWLLQPPTAGAITPANIAARRVTKIGCANIEPRRTDHTIVLVQKFARRIMEYFADVFSGKFSAPDLAATAKHLTAGYIDEIAYQQELTPVVWSRVNGALRGCSYSRDSLMSSQGPKMAGWHRHTLGSGRIVESISVGPSKDGNLDSLTVVTNDTSSNIRHVEIMTNVYEEGDSLADAWYLDNAVKPTSITTTDIGTADAPYGSMTLNGLWHQNGKTVQIFAAGLDLGQRSQTATTYTDFTVTNGSITVPYGDGISAGPGAGLFTAAFAAAAAAAGQIVVGFTYTSDGQIVRPNAPQESGARNGPAFGKKRRSQKFAILVDNTAGLSIGTTFDKLDPVLFKDEVGNSLAPGQTYSGIYKTTLTDNYSYDSMLCWRVTRPLPANVMAIGPNLHTQDE